MADAGWVSSKDKIRNGRRVRVFEIKALGILALNRGREFYGNLARFMATEGSAGG
jgi:hypothetical protein